jgi:hypothetical protein
VRISTSGMVKKGGGVVVAMQGNQEGQPFKIYSQKAIIKNGKC